VIARFQAWFARLSIRLKLTLAFAGVSAVLLGGLALALYFAFQSGLDDGINRSLQARAAELSAAERGGKASLAAHESSGAFAQILSVRGQVIDATQGLRHTPLLSEREISRLTGPTLLGGPNSRLLARRLHEPPREVLVVGVSLAQRDHALTVLGDLLFFGGPLMLLASSGAAYLVAANALAPVERMRRRAAEISGGERDARLPVPASNDVLSRLGETLNAMLARVSEGISRERALVSHASHELRTPLAVLKLELELALDPQRSREEMADALRSAVEEVDRLTRLASDLLVIARAGDGQLPVRRTAVDVAAMVRNTGERFDRIARTEGRSIVVEAPETLVAAVDPDRLEQALDNLLTNALRHGAGTVEVEARAGEGSVEIHVLDEGPGFPEAFLPHAFEPFTRAEVSRTGEATGLGLSIVRAIAEAHGGAAGAGSRDGGGGHVWVVLRAGEPVVETTARAGQPQVAAGAKPV
jgi:two-component system OmpR family sensor kinase